MLYSMLIDDVSISTMNRVETRKIVDDLLARPLMPLDPTDEGAIEKAKVELDETWGLSPEAIAAQESGVWL